MVVFPGSVASIASFGSLTLGSLRGNTFRAKGFFRMVVRFIGFLVAFGIFIAFIGFNLEIPAIFPLDSRPKKGSRVYDRFCFPSPWGF